jgi:hypothetical protein
MDFEDIQKIWDAQTSQTLYVINENALYKRIQAKKNQTHHITNATEWFAIFVNGAGGSFVFTMNIFSHSKNIWLYAMALWTLAVALYVLISRIRRTKNDLKFDRTIRGELNYAISVAAYQVNLSYLMRWNILPLGSLLVLATWGGGKSIWLSIAVLALLAVAHYFSGWEHNFYKSRKNELENLKHTLES